MQNKDFVYILFIIALSVLAVSAGVFYFRRNPPPSPEQSSTSRQPSVQLTISIASSSSTSRSSSTTSTNKAAATPTSNTWSTYSNSKYSFSISYPCDSDCQASPPVEWGGDSFEEYTIQLPVSSKTDLAISMFSESDMQKWNDAVNVYAPSYIFPYSLNSLRTALTRSVGQRCALSDYYKSSMPAYAVKACAIVSFDNQKAIRLVADREGRWDAPKVRYLIPRHLDLWLQIDQRFPDQTFGVVNTDQLLQLGTPQFHDELEAANRILKTLTLGK